MVSRELFRQIFERGFVSHAYALVGNDQEEQQHIVNAFREVMGIQMSDVCELDPEGQEGSREITIGQIRELREFASTTAWASPYKVVVMRNADTMNVEAQSAFLKILEDPKGAIVFFLCALHAHSLLPTIRSRVQEYAVSRFDSPKPTPNGTRNFLALRQADLPSRFKIAKELADEPRQVFEALHEWTVAARAILRDSVRSDIAGAAGIAHSIRAMEYIRETLRSTNANTRLALERLMFDI